MTPATSDTARSDGPERLSLLASAIASRDLKVSGGRPGEPAWTDGRVVFVDAGVGARQQLEAVAVQAALLAAGSLDGAVVRHLAWRPALAARYLAVEGHRALAGLADLLPPSLRSLIDLETAAGTDSPVASLAAARSRATIPSLPDSFGTIRARSLLAISRADAAPPEGGHAPRAEATRLSDAPADDDGDATELFSSPVGGAGAFGRLLGRLLEAVRRLDVDGPPGADAATHRLRAAARPGAHRALSTARAGRVEDAAATRRGTTYPEWDSRRRRYRPDWCTVREVEAPAADIIPPAPREHRLRRPLARLGMGLDGCHRRLQGDDIDIDAAVEARVELTAGSAPDEAVYVESLRRRRDLAVLLLLDVSGSAAQPGANGRAVHEQQRAAAAALMTALHDLGDRVALYAYHSRGRSAVELVPVKRFEDALDPLVMRRLHGLEPCAYSRLGAAIRHGAAVLEDRGATSRRLLVVLSDGLAYDHGYEPAHGAADARRALAEARRRGTGCLCLSIGASTDAETLRRVFGSVAHATIPRTEHLSRVIGPLFRAALRSAEGPRRPMGRR